MFSSYRSLAGNQRNSLIQKSVLYRSFIRTVHSLAFVLVLVIATAWVLAQQSNKIEEDVSKVTEIAAEYQDHVSKYNNMEKQFKAASQAIRQAEIALAQIQTEAKRREAEAMNTALASMQLTDMLIANENQGKDKPQKESDRIAQNTNRFILQQEQRRAEFNLMMQSNDMQRLNIEQRNVVNRGAKAYQDLVELQTASQSWYQEKQRFVDQFWDLIDLDNSRSTAETELIVSALEDHGGRIPEALLIQGILEIRLGRNAEGIRSIESAADLDSTKALKGVLHAARSFGYAAREDKKRSKSETSLSMNFDKTNPKSRWLRFVVAAEQNDYGLVKTESELFKRNPVYEVAASRIFILATANKKERTKKEADLMLKTANQVIKLTGNDDWLSQLVLSIAQKESGDKEAALISLGNAKGLATDSNVEVCNQVEKFIESDEALNWKFISRDK